MPLHAKTRSRIKILLACGLLLTVAAAGAYVFRKNQIASRLRAERDAGYAALRLGEYYNALHSIGPYLKRYPSDAEALASYALARIHVEEANGRHIAEGIQLYRRLLDLTPADEAAREQLLDLYVKAGYSGEILEATTGRDDPPSLRARAIALSRANKGAEGLELALKYLQTKPDDVQMQMFTLAQQNRLNQPAEQIFARVAALAEAHPNDPRYEVVLGFAHALADDRTAALEWTRKAASRDLNDPDLVTLIVNQLDALDRFDESSALLEKTANVRGSVVFQRLIFARLYQSGRLEDVVQRLAELENKPDEADTELLAYRALALMDLKRYDELAKVVELLESRNEDFVAQGWAGVLKALPREGTLPDARAVISACREALKSAGGNPYFRLYLGDALAYLSESQEARREWSAAGSTAHMWPAPLIRVLRAADPSVPVRDIANRLEKLAPNDPQAIAVIAVSRFRIAPQRDAAFLTELIEQLDRALRIDPDEQTAVSAKVQFLNAAGEPEQARQFAQSLLDPQAKPSEAALVSLARSVEAAGLGLEQACYDRARALHGDTPELAFSQAAWMHRSRRTTEALAFFEQARSRAAAPNDPAWALSWAKLLEQAGDPRARDAWRALSEAHPDNLVVQYVTMWAPSTQQDRALVRGAIDRVSAFMGAQGVTWRLADARWVLQGAALAETAAAREQELVKAAALLNDITRQYPDLVPARLMFSDCLAALDKKEGAIEHLSAAARYAPGSLPITLKLAALLQANNDFERARPYLEQAEQILSSASGPAATPDSTAQVPATDDPQALAGQEHVSHESAWRQLASLYVARGQSDRAIAILKRIDADKPATHDLMLEELLARRGELTEESAAALLEKPTLESIQIVTEFYARQGRISDAQTALERLESVDAAAGQKQLVRALYYQRRGDLAKASEHFKSASDADPSLAAAWRGRIIMLIMQGLPDEALSVTAAALRAVPEETSLQRLIDERELLKLIAEVSPARQMFVALIGDESDPSVVTAALRIVRDGHASGQTVLQVLTSLRPLADRAPALVPLQNLVIDLNMHAGRFDEAAMLATRLMQYVPNNPEPARRASEALAAGGRWNEVIGIARQWRDRLGVATLPADEMLANAYLATRDYASAERQLAPHIPQLLKDPSAGVRLLYAYASALIEMGRANDARELLDPMLSSGWPVRRAWMQLTVQHVPADTAPRWIERIAGAIDPANLEEQLALAACRVQLVRRDGASERLSSPNAVLAEMKGVLEGSASAKAEHWVALAILHEQIADPDGAEQAYRKVLQLNPNEPQAQNNLAMILVRKQGDLAEALRLAEGATTAKNHPAYPDFLDTLAQVQAANRRYDAAEQSIRQARQIRPRDLSFCATEVKVLLAAGKPDDSRKVFAELESMVSSRPANNPEILATVESLRTALNAVPQN